MIMASARDLAQETAEFLSGQVGLPTTHMLVAQPPWYQNETRQHDLSDLLGDPPERKQQFIRDSFPGFKRKPQRGLFDDE